MNRVTPLLHRCTDEHEAFAETMLIMAVANIAYRDMREHYKRMVDTLGADEWLDASSQQDALEDNFNVAEKILKNSVEHYSSVAWAPGAQRNVRRIVFGTPDYQ